MENGTVRCPTPAKARYATSSAASQRAAIRSRMDASKVYRPYTCSCGWVHLTTKSAPPMITPSVQTTTELLALPPLEFRFLVACDVKDRLSPAVKDLLRTSEVNRVWISELKLLWMETLREANRSRDQGHRQSIIRFQSYIQIRRTEASALQQRYLADVQVSKEASNHREPPRPTPGSRVSIRCEALHYALMEMVTRHPEEFREVYVTKLRELWPDDSEFGTWLPLKYLHYLNPKNGADPAEESED